MITAAHLYDHVACPHRVYLDHTRAADGRDPISPFVKLLWERGSTYEATVIDELPDGSFVHLKNLRRESRISATAQAMESGAASRCD